MSFNDAMTENTCRQCEDAFARMKKTQWEKYATLAKLPYHPRAAFPSQFPRRA